MIFVLTSHDHIDACMEWLEMVPDFAIEEIKAIRLKHSHCSCQTAEAGTKCRRPCDVVYEIDLCKVDGPVTAVRQKVDKCRACYMQDRQGNRIARLVTSIPITDERIAMSKVKLREILGFMKLLLNSGFHSS